MIRGLHGMFYSSEAEAARGFLRDVLHLPFTDIGRGWLIFNVPEADVGIHPADSTDGRRAGTHDVSFYCDDIQGTVAELKKRGVRFTQEPVDQGYGMVTYFEMPGGIQVQLYEPKYEKGGAKPEAAKAPRGKNATLRPMAMALAKKAPAKAAPAKKKAPSKPARPSKKAAKRARR